MHFSSESVLRALSKVIEPDLKRDLVTLGMIQNLRIEDHNISFSIILTTPACPFKDSMKRACEKAIKEHLGGDVVVEVTMEAKTTGKKPAQDALLPGVKNIIAVASGKGGVGKSTVAANLAVSLAKTGASVGLVDADIYGPSIPVMFGVVDEQLASTDQDGKVKVYPFQKFGISLISIGFFVDASRALIWRGPMASGALMQLFTDVIWGDLDYMIIDMPPGTGDIHLSITQSLKLTGVVVVSTPQEVALADARKAVSMFRNAKLNVQILGMVENMSWFTPSELPDNKYYIFGKEGCRKLAAEMKIPFLGEIPLVQSVREAGDEGQPVVLRQKDITSPYFDTIAGNVARQVSMINAGVEQQLTL